MLNKTLVHLDLSHNKIGNAGARKIAKYLLHNEFINHLNLSDNQIHYEGSRYLSQALRVNKSLRSLNLKLNRIDDKGGSKLCYDLHQYGSMLEFISLSSNSLGHMFCESLSEYIKINKYIRRFDISCNFIDDGSASTLKDALQTNTNIIEIDIRNNQFSDVIEQDMKDIVTKNMLHSKNIPYKKITDCKYSILFYQIQMEIS